MKKWMFFGLFIGLVLSPVVFTSCGDDDEEDNENVTPQPKPDEQTPDTPQGVTLTYSALKYEKLPDMSVPRRGHSLIAAENGDIVAVGGHTTGFQLAPSAERLNNGKWEKVGITNAHDGSANIALPDGRFLICGGMGKALGVGQSAACDIYDPSTHSFSPTASLKTARGFCAGVPTGEGNNVLLSGNWYNSDKMFELWDGNNWTAFGSKSVELNNPYVANAGNGIVYVFGCRSNYGNLQKVVVYKVNTKDKTSEVVENTGLEEYEVLHGDYMNSKVTHDGGLLCLGMKDKKVYLLVFDTKTAKVTELTALPMEIPDVTTEISYSWGILVNPSRNEAYIIGAYKNQQKNALVVVSCNVSNKKMTVYHGGQFDGCMNWGAWAVQSSTGKIVITGGSVKDNFDPITSAILVTPF